MTIKAHEYFQNFDYSNKDTIPNDLLFLLPSPIILKEKGSILHLTPLEVKQDKSFVDQIRFFIQITDSIGTPIIKNVHVIARGNSKESIVKIETLFSETPFDSTCLVTLNSIASKFRIIEKKIEVQDSIEISGKLLYFVNEKPLCGTAIIVALRQKQRHEMNSHIQECKTSEDGYFKATFSKNDLKWKETSFWFSFHHKIAEEVSIEFDFMNSHFCEKVAVIALLFDSL